MTYLRWLAHEVLFVARVNSGWMAWNLILATIPAALALGLFRTRARHGLAWWVGVGLFVLFLPNAPYLVTDLIHLRGGVAAAPSDSVVVAGVLPLYGALVGSGFVLYAICIRAVRAEVARTAPRVNTAVLITGIHALSAVGVVIGRMARLNSWDTVTTPVGTLERSVETLTWRGAPAAVFVMFAVISLGYAVTSALMTALDTSIRRVIGRRRLGPRPAI